MRSVLSFVFISLCLSAFSQREIRTYYDGDKRILKEKYTVLANGVKIDGKYEMYYQWVLQTEKNYVPSIQNFAQLLYQSHRFLEVDTEFANVYKTSVLCRR